MYLPEPTAKAEPVAIQPSPDIVPEELPEFHDLLQVLREEHSGLIFDRPTSRDPYYEILLRLEEQPGLDFPLLIAIDHEYGDFQVEVSRRSGIHRWEEHFDVYNLVEVVGGLITGHVRILEQVKSNGVAFQAELQAEREGQWVAIAEWRTWTWFRRGPVTQRIVRNGT